MNVILVVENGSNRSRKIRLRQTKTLVGRQRGCDLRIPSARVSRRHCVLTCQGNSLTVEDLNSANGTQLNGVRIRGKHGLSPGDRLSIGPVTFLVQRQPTKVTSNLDEDVPVANVEILDESVPMANVEILDEEVPVADVQILVEEEDWGDDLIGMGEDPTNEPGEDVVTLELDDEG